MATQPDLGITNPYQLNDAQFAAAIDLLEKQRDAGALYWGTYSDQIASYGAGDVDRRHVLAVPWSTFCRREDQPIEGVLPDEGSTGWSDTWMIAKAAKNPNCMYMWMDHMARPRPTGRPPSGSARRRRASSLRRRRDPLARTLRADARDGRGLLRQDLVLGDPAGRLRRYRRGHDVQGPGRLGRSLDRHSAAADRSTATT